MKRNKTIHINVNELKTRPVKISMAMEKRGEVAEMPEIAEAEMPARNDRWFSRKHLHFDA